MTIKDLMMLYGVTLGKRKTKKQRYLAAMQIKETFEAAGFPVRVQRAGSRLFPVENIIAGNLARAETLYVAPFDTPLRSLVPVKYYPFHPEKTLKEERKDVIIRFLAAFLLFLLSFLFYCLGMWDASLAVGMWILAFLFLVFGLFVLRGNANPVNFNRWSASMALMAKLAENFSSQAGTERGKIAFAFCDRAAVSYEGYKLLLKEAAHISNVILLDCLAKGETLVAAHGRNTLMGEKIKIFCGRMGARERIYKDEEINRNLLSLFPGGVLLTSGRIRDGEFVVEGTRSKKDYQIDIPRLTRLAEELTYMSKMN